MYKNTIAILLKRYLTLLLLFSFSRLMFHVFNLNCFSELSFSEILKAYFYGLKYDNVIICIFNSLFIILHFVPGKFTISNIFQKSLKWYFVIVNMVLISFNFIDIKYFDFTNKRSTVDLFHLMSTSDDVFSLIPVFIKDYWFLLLIWLGFGCLLFVIYPKQKNQEYQKIQNLQQIISHSILMIFILVLLFIGARGSLGVKPLREITASKYVSVQNIPLVLNTPFTVLKSIGKQGLEIKSYYTTTKELEKVFNIQHNYSDSINGFKTKNVVVIIMESFSREYIGGYNDYKGYTPFLDSLMQKSFVFKNAFANGKKSIEAVPSILSSMPSLMDNPFITSIYASNKIQSLAYLLKPYGYHTSFFHGGKNGTMGFDQFVMLAGFDKYYGRYEYNNEDDFDGNWGILDEPFFQFFSNTLSSLNEPFATCIFSLSSHHPYMIPAKYSNKFPKGDLNIHESIGYADYSLSHFFETAKQTNWYNNTIFIITADHTAQSSVIKYSNSIGNYAIPLIIFTPGDTIVGSSEKIAQQIDILPTIMDYINYPDSFIAFGRSLLNENTQNYAISFNSGIFQFTNSENAVLFDGQKVIGIYKNPIDYFTDKKLKNTEFVKRDIDLLHAIIQTYNNKMVNNQLVKK